jgi:hypothetical protein
MYSKSGANSQAALGRRHPQTFHDVRGVGRQGVQGELDFDVDRFLVLLFGITTVQGDHTTIPQPPARDVPVAARVEGKTDEVEGRVGSR